MVVACSGCMGRTEYHSFYFMPVIPITWVACHGVKGLKLELITLTSRDVV